MATLPSPMVLHFLFKKESPSNSVFFSVGRPQNTKIDLEPEWKQKGDLMLLNMTDSYRRLTYKVLVTLSWIRENCRQLTYVVKSDDDMLLNLPYLIKMLRRLEGEPDQTVPRVIGSIIKHNWVQRNPHNKWFVRYRDFHYPEFPPHASGNAYLLNADALWTILNALEAFRKSWRPILPIEDAFVTGILGSMARVHHCHLPGFTGLFSPAMTVCDFLQQRVFTGTHMNATTLRRFWTNAEHQRDMKSCPPLESPNVIFLRRRICPRLKV